jgi:ElaA protein
MHLRSAATADLDPFTLYGLLALRVAVFVVEQHCPYPELDGRDLEPSTRHFWFDDGWGEPLAYLRVLRDDTTTRIGRVCTAASARRQGLSGQLLTAALGTTAGIVLLDAQAHLVEFYHRFGFTPCGPEFDEDGIPHVPMRLRQDHLA